MAYIFLIFMVGSGLQTDKHIIPMKDMAQCEAALKANRVYDEVYDSNHWGNTAKIDTPRCVEIK